MPQPSDYHVGWICALPNELAAAKAMLEEKHEKIQVQSRNDENNYTTGRIHGHNVVIACLPAGVDGTSAAARVASNMTHTFPHLRFGLLVGIGGGIPDLERGVDIRLGDVVVSKPDGDFGGVVQYDKIKKLAHNESKRKGFLNAPPSVLLTALQSIQADHEMKDSKIPAYLSEMVTQYPKMATKGYSYPGVEHDNLIDIDVHGVETRVERPPRTNSDPSIHYGLIASGNQVVKDSTFRDSIHRQLGACCFEMEAAGLMNDFPCLVIRGIADYADSRKDDRWHNYASAVAACYAKELLGYVSEAKTAQNGVVNGASDLPKTILPENGKQSETIHQNAYKREAQDFQEDARKCHQALKKSNYEASKNVNPERAKGTCKWVLDHFQYASFIGSAGHNLLWISADPGCGKSVLSRSLVDNELSDTAVMTTCYFFFKDNGEQDNVNTALCALLHQLFSKHRHLLKHAVQLWRSHGKMTTSETNALWRLLLEASMDLQSHTVVCVLDALDECSESSISTLLPLLEKFCSQYGSKEASRGRLKFLVTSRPYLNIEDGFRKTLNSFPNIRLRGEDENKQINHEIDLVIRQKVTHLAQELKMTNAVRNRLESKLILMNNRTYLWLHLALDAGRKTYRNSLRPDEESFKLLPATVEDAYENILRSVPVESKSLTVVILKIIVGARRPLYVSEMAVALGDAFAEGTEAAIQIDATHLRQNIRDWCGLFCFIESSKLFLIHQTAKQFLLRTEEIELSSPHRWKGIFTASEPEMLMLNICLKSIANTRLTREKTLGLHLLYMLGGSTSTEEFMEVENYISAGKSNEAGKLKFFEYAAQFWQSHDEAVNKQAPEYPTSLVQKVCESASRWDTGNWFYIYYQWPEIILDSPSHKVVGDDFDPVNWLRVERLLKRSRFRRRDLDTIIEELRGELM